MNLKSDMKIMRVSLLMAIGWLALPQSVWAFYNPSAGRWLNRDPIEEKGAVNIYAFNDNDAANKVDALGLFYQVHSTGRVYRDPWYWSSAWVSQSGDQFSTDASFSQTAISDAWRRNKNFCNSGGSGQGGMSSFVTGKIWNSGKEPICVKIRCEYNAHFSIRIYGAPATSRQGITFRGHLLDYRIGGVKGHTESGSGGNVTYDDGVGSEKRKRLEPGETYEMYYLTDDISFGLQFSPPDPPNVYHTGQFSEE